MLKQTKRNIVKKAINDGKGGANSAVAKGALLSMAHDATKIGAGHIGMPVLGAATTLATHVIGRARDKAEKEIEDLGKQSSDQAESILKGLRERNRAKKLANYKPTAEEKTYMKQRQKLYPKMYSNK